MELLTPMPGVAEIKPYGKDGYVAFTQLGARLDFAQDLPKEEAGLVYAWLQKSARFRKPEGIHMKAVGYKRPLPISAPEALLDIELPIPEAKGKDLLVEVKAISVNPVDAKLRAAAGPLPE